MAASSRKRSKAARPKPETESAKDAVKEPARREPSPDAAPTRYAIAAVVFLLLSVVLYWPAMDGPFVFDDYDMMEGSSAVRNGSWWAMRSSGRPLLTATFIANHRLAGGFEPFGFHLVNALLHGLNALLLCGWMTALFQPGRFGQKLESFRSLFVYGLPLLFLASPIQTESVAYISSRSEVLAATFYISALWAFTAWRGKRGVLAAVVVAVMMVGAVATKQDKLTLPFALFLLDYLVLSKGDWRGLKQNLPTYLMFAVGVVAGVFLVVLPVLYSPSAGFGLDQNAYWLTQLHVLWRYVGQLIAPFALNHDPDIAVSHSLGDNLSWMGLLGLIGVVALTVKFARKAPLPCFAALYFFLVLAPTSVFPLLDFAAERRLYLASIGFFLLLLWGLTRLFESRSNGPWIAVGVLALVYCGGTVARAGVWSNELRLWEDAAQKSPEKARPLTWLGRIYYNGGRLPEAQRYWTQALERVDRGTNEEAYLLANLGLLEAKQKRWEAAVDYYRRAIEIHRREANFWAQLAVAQMRLGRTEEGWKSFEQGARYRMSTGPQFFLLRGQEQFQAGRYEGAVSDFEQVLRQSPENEAAQRNLEIARRAAGGG